MTGRAAGRSFDLSGIAVHVSGLTPDLDSWLGVEWGPFAGSGPADAVLRVTVRCEAEPVLTSASDAKKIRSDLDPERARYWLPEGSVEVDAHGTAALVIRGGGSRARHTLVNLLRAALAWSLPRWGGLFLHAAGLVIEGRAFVLVGPADSGKSTWAALGEREGATVLSDDVVLVVREPEGFVALGAPFRSTHATLSERGRWPLAALLLPAHGPEPRLEAVDPILVRARLLSNVPFVADAFGSDPSVDAVLDDLAASVSARTLTFARDPRFVPLLREIGPAD